MGAHSKGGRRTNDMVPPIAGPMAGPDPGGVVVVVNGVPPPTKRLVLPEVVVLIALEDAVSGTGRRGMGGGCRRGAKCTWEMWVTEYTLRH